MLSQQAISEYQEIYKKTFEKEIDAVEAASQGEKLLRLFRVICKPVPKNWKKELEEKYER